MDTAKERQAPDRDAIRAQLLTERREILGSVESRHEEVEEGPSGISDGSGETEHLTIAEVKELGMHLDRIAEETLSEIDEALARLDEGTYGTCVDCGGQIPAERLEALPTAARCLACQARHG